MALIDSINNQLEKEITNYLDNNPYSSVFHTVAWNRILANFFKKRNEKFSLAIFKNGEKIVGYPTKNA